MQVAAWALREGGGRREERAARRGLDCSRGEKKSGKCTWRPIKLLSKAYCQFLLMSPGLSPHPARRVPDQAAQAAIPAPPRPSGDRTTSPASTTTSPRCLFLWIYFAIYSTLEAPEFLEIKPDQLARFPATPERLHLARNVGSVGGRLTSASLSNAADGGNEIVIAAKYGPGARN